MGTNRNAETALAALGDEPRRQIVECLRERPHSVVDLTARLPVTRPAVSWRRGRGHRLIATSRPARAVTLGG